MTEKIENILDDLVEMVGRVADSLENLVFLKNFEFDLENKVCLLYTSPSPRD